MGHLYKQQHIAVQLRMGHLGGVMSESFTVTQFLLMQQKQAARLVVIQATNYRCQEPILASTPRDISHTYGEQRRVFPGKVRQAQCTATADHCFTIAHTLTMCWAVVCLGLALLKMMLKFKMC